MLPRWAVFIVLSGMPAVTADVAADYGSESAEPWNPCEEDLMGGPGDWAIFHSWCFQVDASSDIDKFAKEDILQMEAKCPDTKFTKGETIRREGPDAIVYKTILSSKYGPIFVAYYRSDCGIVRLVCRAGSEKTGKHAYESFLNNVRGMWQCIH